MEATNTVPSASIGALARTSSGCASGTRCNQPVMPNPEYRIRYRIYARVVIEAQAIPNRVLVPREAVVERNRRDVVFVARSPNGRGEAIAEGRYVNSPAFRRMLSRDD